jgi:hypothetical protein
MENSLGVAQDQAMVQPRPQTPSTSLPGWQTPQATPSASLPGWQTPQATPPAVQQPQMWQMSGSMPRVPATPTSAGSGVQSMGMGNTQANGYAAGVGSNQPGSGQITPGSGNNKNEAQPAKARKKGFFDSIRDFITR